MTCLVLSLELGPVYSIFYLQVYLFEFLLLEVISFLCCGLLLFPKPPLCAPSFVFAVGNHRTISCYLFFKSFVCHLESLNKSNVYALVCSSAGPCELFLNTLKGKEVTSVSMITVGNLERARSFVSLCSDKSVSGFMKY